MFPTFLENTYTHTRQHDTCMQSENVCLVGGTIVFQYTAIPSTNKTQKERLTRVYIRYCKNRGKF